MTKGVLTLVLGFIMAFYVLSSTYSPMETAAIALIEPLGGQVTQTLGTANASGNLTASVSNPPILAASETVYANGLASTSWVNASVLVYDVNGSVVVTASGVSNSTENAAITIDYQHNPGIDSMENIGGLPGTAVLLLVIVILLGLVVKAREGMEL